MRINQMTLYMDEDYKNVLVRESSRNYPMIDYLKEPEDIVHVMNDVYDLSDRSE